MRVEVEPRNATIVPGQPAVLTVRVVNTASVISGHRIRVLGVDPRWVQLDQDQLSLFPDAAGVAVLSITFPPGIPAGLRRIGVEVVELTPPGERIVVTVELTVPSELGLKVALDPASASGGHTAAVGVIVDNTGNGPIDIELAGTDEEAQVTFIFKPAGVTLQPGERALASVTLHAKRPVFGSLKIRPFKVLVGPAQPPVSAFGTWVQKPLLSRGAIALIGLVAAISIFALILTVSLSKVVGQSNADRDLALQVAQGQSGAGGGGSSSLAGTVTLLTSGVGVTGVTVEIYNSSDTATPLASVATSAGGGYKFQGLAAGNYKVRYSGAGFTQLWYPTALTPDNATVVTLTAGQALTGIDARLGGVPASVAGLVQGTDPTGATVSLEVPSPSSTGTSSGSGSTAAPSGSGSAGIPAGTNASPIAAAPSTPGPAIVTTQTLDASGTFSLTQIPSPSTYDLVVAKKGFATVTQEVDLGSGEQRTGIVITLIQGNGSISGQVISTGGPIGGATLSASDGQNTVSTVSLTQGAVGSFVLTNLPTPDTFTITVSASGFASQTLSVTLASDQQVTGVSVNLAPGSGSVSGMATLVDMSPAKSVTVTVTNGQISLQTVTLSTGAAGTYMVSGLPVPGTYTVTFSRPDLASQTKAVTIDARNPAATAINVTLISATAMLSGTVYTTAAASCLPATGGGDSTTIPTTTLPPNTKMPVGGITVSLSSGTNSYQVISALSPAASVGHYEFDNVQPGTYTLSLTRPGGLPVSSILTLAAGAQTTFDPPVLALAASICGVVFQQGATSSPAANAEVRLYASDQFPSGTFQTVDTGSDGSFLFANVNAPQSYVLQFAFPPGSPGQSTLELNVALSQQDDVCPAASANPCTVNTQSGASG